MKKITIIFTITLLIFGIIIANHQVYAQNKAIDEKTESKIVEIKENSAKSLEDYKEKYGSDVYGTVAYILNIVRVLGIRKLDVLEKGMAFIVTSVTLLIICQILPLAFAVFVKFGRG